MEKACEPPDNCNVDQLSFKSYFIRFAAASTKWAPFFYESFQPYLLATAKAAALSCNPGDVGVMCGHKWTTGSFDGQTGVGEQLCALQAIQSLLIQNASLPVTTHTGGTSKGDPTAGTGGDGDSSGGAPVPETITTRDKAGAGALTGIVLLGMICGTWWLVT